ncbi:MAG: sugar transferase [Spirochaetaceae bacterium]|nr:sugar transferase [Myxococcales bacterium]MCB9725980.1 sugar transferase [Spirochaetaceae bacterium]
MEIGRERLRQALDRLGRDLAVAGGPRSRRRTPHYAAKKRALDLAICLAALPFALPVLLVCAALVKLTSEGPVFFVQERTGQGGRRFRMLKFRTMVKDAPALRARLAEQLAHEGPDFKLVDDPRMTPIGRVLRKTSLDESPQLWNVLCGDMSLVGPRPTSFAADRYDLWHTERLEVPPGLTGLWQVEARGDIDFDERVRRDIAYVRNRSLALDLSILLRTIPAVLLQRGAY